MNRRILVLLVVLALAGAFAVKRASSQSESMAKRRVFNAPDRPAQAAFSNAIQAGDTLYLAGSIGLDPKTGKAPDKIDDEIKNLLDGYKSLLAQAGYSMDDLVTVQVFCTDLSTTGSTRHIRLIFRRICRRERSLVRARFSAGAILRCKVSRCTGKS